MLSGLTGRLYCLNVNVYGLPRGFTNKICVSMIVKISNDDVADKRFSRSDIKHGESVICQSGTANAIS